tara:strand:+ start:49 stop:534 length:486 start_codon:yes stop_codon:yes gene_type:complete
MESKEKTLITKVQEISDIKSKTRIIVESFYKIDLFNPTRIRIYVEARSMYFKLLKDNTKMTLAEIGASVGKHHSSVVHLVNQINFDIERIPEMRSKYSRLLSLYNKCILEPIDENYALVEITASYENLKNSYEMLSKNYTLLMEKHKILTYERERRRTRTR